MESYKEIDNSEMKQQLINSFPIKEITFGELSFGGTIPLVFVLFNSNECLRKHWKDFNSQVSLEYLTNLEDEYSRWNFYIFYFSDVKVPKSIKYEIENNKFSSRKIVIEQCETITEDEIERAISEHITNDNIQINVSSKQSLGFKKNPYLAKIIDKLNLNKKNEEDLQKALDTIEKNYTDEI